MEKTNKAGQIYPWEIENYDYNTYYKFNQYSYNIQALYNMFGKAEKMLDDTSYFNNVIVMENDEYPSDLVEQGKIFGAVTVGPDRQVKMKPTVLTDNYANYVSDAQQEGVKECYERMLAETKGCIESLREQYKDAKNPVEAHYDKRANQFADYWTDINELYGPGDVNMMEADFHCPYLYELRGLMVAIPKFDSEGFTECVNALEQIGVEGGQPIYNDYMTMMCGGLQETKIQVWRQKAEAEGWNLEKEQKYLADLRLSHSKIVNAYDNLWNVEDHGQYDKYLNNRLGHMLGKDPTDNRDINAAIGLVRGELKAIDLGYDSRSLHGLAQLGEQDQRMKKLYAQCERGAGTEKYDRLKEQLDAYSVEFNELKNAVWDKPVRTREEMDRAINQIESFFEEHMERFPEIQDTIPYYKNSLDYVKEEREKAGPMPTPTIVEGSVAALGEIVTEVAMTGVYPEAIAEYPTIATSNSFDLEKKLKPEPEKQAKDLAKRISEALEGRISELDAEIKANPETARTKKVQSMLAEGYKFKADIMRSGIDISSGSPFIDKAFHGVMSFSAHRAGDLFEPEKSAGVEKGVRELNLDGLFEAAFELEKKTLHYELHKNGMPEKEKNETKRDLDDARRSMIGMVREAREKLMNPSPEVLGLFANEGELKNFRDQRGISVIENALNIELNKIEIPQLNKFEKALDKFNTSRAFIFSDESPEHKAMREAAEKVQENMRKLAAGGEEEVKGTRAFTPEERDALLKDTFEKINDLKAKTKAYIDHAEPKGKAPRTGAGKDRLAGAKAVRDITKDLEKAISKEPKIRELKQEAMKKQAQKKQAEKQQTAKKAEAEKARTK